MVNNVRASTYIALDESSEYVGGIPLLPHHTLAHWFVTPWRVLCQSHRIRDATKEVVCHSYNDQGIPYYVAFGIGLGQWLLAQSGTLGVLLLTTAIMIVRRRAYKRYGT